MTKNMRIYIYFFIRTDSTLYVCSCTKLLIFTWSYLNIYLLESGLEVNEIIKLSVAL